MFFSELEWIGMFHKLWIDYKCEMPQNLQKNYNLIRDYNGERERITMWMKELREKIELYFLEMVDLGEWNNLYDGKRLTSRKSDQGIRALI